VDAYAGYRANERPEAFWLDARMEETELKGVYEIEAVEDRWYDPNAEYFKVRTVDGKRYILRYDERADEWTLQSDLDGVELLGRPNIELVTVGPEAIRAAELRIAGCGRCRPDESDNLFDSILADVLGKHGPFEFVLTETARSRTAKRRSQRKRSSSRRAGLRLRRDSILCFD
jgi:hypothetical protein